MQLDPAINQALNAVLKDALTLINQTFLHARMLENWGVSQLGAYDYTASITAMKQADRIITRILFLEGLPNLQALGSLAIGEDTAEIIACDLSAMSRYRETIIAGMTRCETEQDYQSRDHLEELLEQVEAGIDFYETQQSLIADLGLANYLQSQVETEND